MIALGVDPGTINTGWGVVLKRGSKLSGVAFGVITAPRTQALEQRLHRIFEGLEAVIREHQPTDMAVEDVFSRHAKSALILGQARGVILLAGARANLEVNSYPPAVVKRSVGGSGQIPKEQLGRIVSAMLCLETLPKADATDALAIAITHCNASALLRT